MTSVAGLIFGVLGLATVLIEPNVGLLCGVIGLACSWLALRKRRTSLAYAALVLNIGVLAAVLAIVLFGSGTKSG